MVHAQNIEKQIDGKFISPLILSRTAHLPPETDQDQSGSITFERLIDEYLQAVRSELRSILRIEVAVVALSSLFAGRDMTTLRRLDVSSYIQHRRKAGRSNGTINRELDVLSAAINYAVKHWEWPLPNPTKGMSLKLPEGRLRWLTKNEAHKLVAVAEAGLNHCLGSFIQLALNTGMRLNEMLKLEWSRVDIELRRIRLDGAHTKNGRRRFIPLNRLALNTLTELLAFRAEHCPSSPWVFCWPDGSRVTRLHEQFQTAKKRAGIDDFRIHDLRHTFASWLVSAGVPLTEVRDLLGHASVRETERYAHLAPDRLSKAVEVLEF